MSERLTVSLEDGRLEQLRTLAGGERKVGAYLSQVVAWLLWPHKEELDAAGPAGCVILRKDKLEDLPSAEAEAMWRATQQLQAEADEVRALLEALRNSHAELKVKIDAAIEGRATHAGGQQQQ